MKKRRAWNLKGMIISHLRKIFFYCPLRQAALKAAKQKLGYKCNVCKKNFDKVKIDHVNPVVDPAKGFVDWNTFIDRLFCDVQNLQACCEECHNAKTKAEKKKRKN